MSSQTTREVTREEAIDRIALISKLVKNEDYIGIEECSYEDSTPTKIVHFVECARVFKKKKLRMYTDSMLLEILDTPYFRFSMFDNYEIEVCK